MAFRLELSASFDYHDNLLPDFPKRLARTSSRRPFYFGLEKSLSSRSVQLNLTPPSWRFSCGFGEDPCKMALVGEPAPERYFNERGIGRQHQILGHLDASLHQPAMWGNASAASKCLRKVGDRESALMGKLFQ
jgi:hypothetical protein